MQQQQPLKLLGGRVVASLRRRQRGLWTSAAPTRSFVSFEGAVPPQWRRPLREGVWKDTQLTAAARRGGERLITTQAGDKSPSTGDEVEGDAQLKGGGPVGPGEEWKLDWDEAVHDTLTKDQITKIGKRSQEEWLHHITLSTRFPASSYAPPAADGSEDPTDPITVRRKRLIYRSKQRGWLEVDLLLGSWAQQHVHGLTVEQMDEYEAILNCETVDIYNFICGAQQVPDRFNTSVMKTLQSYALESPVGAASPKAYAAAKRRLNLT